MKFLKITLVLVLTIFLAILSSGCTGSGDSGYVVKEKQPDIRIASSNIDTNWGLAKGYTATVSLTLTNYGDADGIITIEFIGDSKGSLGQKNIFVPAQNSVTDIIELDTSASDNSITYKILNQRKP